MKRPISVCAALPLCAGIMAMASGSVYGAPNEIKNITREEVGAELNDNYYCFVNFERFIEAELPYDREMMLCDDDPTMDILFAELKNITEDRSSYEYGSNEQKIADCYFQLRDTDSRNKAGIDSLLPAVEMVESAGTIDELIAVSAEILLDYGAVIMFNISVDSGSFDSSKYHASILPMSMPVEPENFFKVYGTAERVQKTFKSVIEYRSGDNAAQRAKNATDLLIEIADDVMNQKEIMDHPEKYVNCTIDEFKEIFTADVSPYTDILTSNGETSVTLKDIDGIKSMAEQLTNENLQAWKDALVTMILYSYNEVLPDEYLSLLSLVCDAPEALTEQRAAEKTILIMLKEFEYIYTSERADESRITAAKEFTESIIKAYEKVIEKTEGLDPQTMDRFKKKLENCAVNINIPEAPYDGEYEWKPIENGGDLLSNVIAKNRGSVEIALDRLGTTFDPTEYRFGAMPSFTFANACYSTANYVTVPYATICEPFYSPDNELPQNLGRLGYIVGHELSHAFDSVGIKYDENGNIAADWISSEYSKLLEEKEKNITELYDSQKLFGIYPINGEKTLSENMADIASVQCMLSMLDRIEDKKEFMETFAKGQFSYKYDIAAFEQIMEDEHSPDEFRVNTVLSQMDDFYDVYGITDGEMYTAPADRRRVW